MSIHYTHSTVGESELLQFRTAQFAYSCTHALFSPSLTHTYLQFAFNAPSTRINSLARTCDNYPSPLRELRCKLYILPCLSLARMHLHIYIHSYTHTHTCIRACLNGFGTTVTTERKCAASPLPSSLPAARGVCSKIKREKCAAGKRASAEAEIRRDALRVVYI